jgi:hypothetical protein
MQPPGSIENDSHRGGTVFRLLPQGVSLTLLDHTESAEPAHGILDFGLTVEESEELAQQFRVRGLLLRGRSQARYAALDDRLEMRFREWHPKFRTSPAVGELLA